MEARQPFGPNGGAEMFRKILQWLQDFSERV
jgi:hypothetical protein